MVFVVGKIPRYVAASAYIPPNVGVVELPDPRLAQLAAIVGPERVVPSIVEFVDIAGLKALDIRGHEFHPEWNYTVMPRLPKS